jgi:WD40 repeat protein
MNKIETIVYGVVKSHPGIKKAIKSIYQGAFDLLPRKEEVLPVEHDFKEGFFFGFHDVSPFSPEESKCLAHKVPFEGRMPNKGESIEIGFFDVKNGKLGDFHKISESFAWNFHKGCRLQWIDDNKVIYNTADGDKLISESKNITTGEIRKYEYPIDAVYYNGGELLATNFCYERLNRCMPGYGYAVNDGDSLDSAPKDSGLFLVDLIKNTRKMLVSLKELASTVGREYSDGYTHFVTHTEFSHDGNYVAFLYRAVPIGQEGKDMHKTWILVYDLHNEKVITLPTQQSGSHYVWNSKNQIIASCVIDGKSCHVLYDLADPEKYKIIAGDTLNSDGHQTFVSDDVFVTDTYPDRRRMAKLFVVNIEDNSVKMIADVYSPKQFQTKDVNCHIACDLHPRVSPSKKYISFDSPRTGKRALYIMNL